MSSERKTYTYKIFNGSTYVADIDPKLIKSDFSYIYAVNSFSAQVQITLSSEFANISPSLSIDQLVTGGGDDIVSESGEQLVANTEYTFGSLPLFVGYYLQVYVSYPGAPNGIRVFYGTIMSWEANYGSDNTIIITAMSNGLRLKNYILMDAAQTTTNPAFNSYDPSDIVRAILNQYTELGTDSDELVTESGENLVDESANNLVAQIALLMYSDSSVEDTGTTVSYTFQLNTLMEALQKCLELAPGGWYFAFDIGSGELTFATESQTPDHTFTLGKHLSDLQIGYTIEELANTVYYSGGDAGAGVNVLVTDTDTGSVGRYGTWLEKVSDQRVTTTSTADILAQGVLDAKAQPAFRCEATILATNYDIETISAGQMVSFVNSDSITSSLLMQVIQVRREPDKITLSLNSMVPRVSHRIEDIKRNLDVVNALNNPDLPS